MKTYRPAQPTGNLYYVRLKTPAGPLYKLGFTTMKSVQERFTFQGEGHEELIDKVMFFGHFDDAFDIEEQLHLHFHNKAVFRKTNPKAYGPLYKNGQSELYAEDILGLDADYVEAQSELTRRDLRVTDLEHKGMTKQAAHKEIARDKLMLKAIPILFYPLFLVINAVVWLWVKLIEDENKLKKEDAQRKARRVQDEAKKERLLARIRQAHAVQAAEAFKEVAKHDPDEYQMILTTRALERQTRVIKLKIAAIERRISDQVLMAIRALKDKDLTRFEELVDVNLLIFNFTEAMTSKFLTGSDYLIVANNTYMVNLLDAMMAPGVSSRDLLLKPVEETYKAVLRHYVRTHTILTEDILVPPGPLYEVDLNIEGSSDNGLSTYFGLGTLLGEFGRDITLADTHEFELVDGAIHFPIHVRNPAHNFEGDLVVAARMTSSNKLALNFPNFRELQEEAIQSELAY